MNYYLCGNKHNAGIVLEHFTARQSYVRDSDDEQSLLLHARVRSGDYFETVATEIDRAVHTLATTGTPQAGLVELVRLVAELIAVNRHYEVRPKTR